MLILLWGGTTPALQDDRKINAPYVATPILCPSPQVGISGYKCLVHNQRTTYLKKKNVFAFPTNNLLFCSKGDNCNFILGTCYRDFSFPANQQHYQVLFWINSKSIELMIPLWETNSMIYSVLCHTIPTYQQVEFLRLFKTPFVKYTLVVTV